MLPPTLQSIRERVTKCKAKHLSLKVIIEFWKLASERKAENKLYILAGRNR